MLTKTQWSVVAGVAALCVVGTIYVAQQVAAQRVADDNARVAYFNSILDLSAKGRERKPDPVPDWRTTNQPATVDKFGLSMTTRPRGISEFLTDKQRQDIDYITRHCREVVRVDCLPPAER